jgi:hypothetical protein
LLAVDDRQVGGALGVDLDPFPLVVRDLFALEDRVHWALRDAGAAIDAHLGIDVEHLVVAVEAVHRAHGHAVREPATQAVIRYDGRHGSLLLLGVLVR